MSRLAVTSVTLEIGCRTTPCPWLINQVCRSPGCSLHGTRPAADQRCLRTLQNVELRKEEE